MPHVRRALCRSGGHQQDASSLERRASASDVDAGCGRHGARALRDDIQAQRRRVQARRQVRRGAHRRRGLQGTTDRPPVLRTRTRTRTRRPACACSTRRRRRQEHVRVYLLD